MKTFSQRLKQFKQFYSMSDMSYLRMTMHRTSSNSMVKVLDYKCKLLWIRVLAKMLQI